MTDTAGPARHVYRRTLDITGTIMGRDVTNAFEYFKIIPTLSTVQWTDNSLTRESHAHRSKPHYTCVRTIQYQKGDIDMPTSGDTEQYSLDYSYRLVIDAREIPINLPSQITGSDVTQSRPSIRYLTFKSACDIHRGYEGDILDLDDVVSALKTPVVHESKDLVELDIAISWFHIEDFERLACTLPKSCRKLTIQNTVEACDQPLELLNLLELPREAWSSMT